MSEAMKTQRPRTLLVVEDEPELLKDLSEHMSLCGFKVIQASDGLEASLICETEQPDAIITDLNMPKKSGLSFIQDLRDRGDETPVIVLTAYNDSRNMLQAMRLGVVDFIGKPYQFDRLFEIIDRAAKIGVAIRETEENIEDLLLSEQLPREKYDRMRRLKLALTILRHGGPDKPLKEHT